VVVAHGLVVEQVDALMHQMCIYPQARQLLLLVLVELLQAVHHLTELVAVLDSTTAWVVVLLIFLALSLIKDLLAVRAVVLSVQAVPLLAVQELQTKAMRVGTIQMDTVVPAAAVVQLPQEGTLLVQRVALVALV
jgi:hypothetical protein